jgi:hypothetical protein
MLWKVVRRKIIAQTGKEMNISCKPYRKRTSAHE